MSDKSGKQEQVRRKTVHHGVSRVPDLSHSFRVRDGVLEHGASTRTSNVKKKQSS